MISCGDVLWIISKPSISIKKFLKCTVGDWWGGSCYCRRRSNRRKLKQRAGCRAGAGVQGLVLSIVVSPIFAGTCGFPRNLAMQIGGMVLGRSSWKDFRS